MPAYLLPGKTAVKQSKHLSGISTDHDRFFNGNDVYFRRFLSEYAVIIRYKLMLYGKIECPFFAVMDLNPTKATLQYKSHRLALLACGLKYFLFIKAFYEKQFMQALPLPLI